MSSNTMEFYALGTLWWIEFLGFAPKTDHKKKILEIVNEFEARYSRFDPKSIISRLNNEKIIRNDSSEFEQMLNFALKMFDETSGIFNISVGGELEKLGYGKIKDINSKISNALREDVIISKDEIKLSSHIRIDLGGFGKGWLIDKLGNFLSSNDVYFIINGGGDILVNSSNIEKIVLEHPLDSRLIVGEVNIKNGALAGSSPRKRQWTDKGVIKHHIINPSSPYLTADIASGFVTAPTALIADVLSTVFLLVNPSERVRLSKKYKAEYLHINSDMLATKSAGFKVEIY